MRMRKKQWADAELAASPYVVLEADSISDLFENDRPVYLELGMGKGGFITESASRSPNINFVGVERQKSVCAVAARKISGAAHNGNIKILYGDVRNMERLFEHGGISRIFINFCDPWPKARNAKRRLTHEGFLKKYLKALNAGGQVYFKTDNAQLFYFSFNEFIKCGFILRHASLDLHSCSDSDNVMTEYERKFSEKGVNIFRIIAVKPD